jgi:ribose transport system substrate-binding protein
MNNPLRKLAALFACGFLLTPAVAKAEEPLRIGVSIPSADHGWTGGVNYAAREAKKRIEAAYGDKVKITIVAANNAQEQANGLEDLVAVNKINALVILPYESAPLTEPVKRVKEKGVFVTVVDRGLTEPGIEDLYVAGDNPGMGAVTADYFLKTLKGKGASIVILRGIPTVVDTERYDAFTKKLEGSDIKVLDSKFANWNRDDGFKIMQDYLTRFPKIDAVWAQDDDVALGVLDAIKQAKREKELFVVGGAGMKDIIKRVMDKDPIVPVDVLYPPYMVGTAIELTALKAVTSVPIRGRYIINAPLVTSENAKEYYFPDSPF